MNIQDRITKLSSSFCRAPSYECYVIGKKLSSLYQVHIGERNFEHISYVKNNIKSIAS